MYFTADTPDELELRELVDALYRRIDWRWAQDGTETLRLGWKPECGFLNYGWEGYTEAIVLYALALASPTHPIGDHCYEAWTATYQWENLYGYDLLYAGPLFVHQFSHAWIDFRGIQDRFMREKRCDYFENSRRATLVQREYAQRNPLRARPGHRRDDDRKPSQPADLAADAELPSCRHRLEARRLPRRLALAAPFIHGLGAMQQFDDPSSTLPQDSDERERLENVHPPGWRNPRPADRYNLVVVGAGTAGLVAAHAAAALGAKVALIERDLLGGDCLNVGCVPSKAIIRTSRLYAEMHDAEHYGVQTPAGIRVDFPAVMQRMRGIRARMSRADSVRRLSAAGVDVFFG